jgi:acyl-coenzyme A synthetase/AMP-(fatty) acid ligase
MGFLNFLGIASMTGHSLNRYFGPLYSENVTLDALVVSDRVSQLATGIRNKLRYEKSSYIPVFVDYSIESQLFILAMAASGYNFALVDSTTPAPLLEKQLQQLNSQVGISARAALGVSEITGLKSILSVEDMSLPIQETSRAASSEGGSLVIFSSGSTGNPKGIVLPWAELDDWIQIRLEWFGASSQETPRIINFQPLSWIAGVLNLLSCQFGVEVHTLDPLRYSPKQLLTRIQEVDPHYLLLTGHLATSLGRSAESSTEHFFSSLKQIHFGSSSIKWETVNQFKNVLPADVIVGHVYGSSEAMRPLIFACPFSEAPESGVVPLGVPREPDNLQLRSYGENTYEIVVAGNIAAGYLDKTLTSEKFVKDENGKTWWSSGDLVRIDEASGIHYFAGRMDDFVKVNDHNVSLLAVDNALRTHPSVETSVTITADSSGRARIVSFIQPAPHSNFDPEQVILFLRSRLPSYSLPQLVLSLDAVPLTRSGKPDQSKLRALARADLSEHLNGKIGRK